MKAKRLAAVLMSGALAAGTLAGCGGGGNSSGGEGGDSGSGKIELEFFTQKREAADTFEKIITQFNESQDEIKVTQNIVPDSTSVLMSRAATGDLPDIIQVGGMQDSNTMQFMKEGHFLDISGMECLGQVVDDYQEAIKFKGKNYVVPISANFSGVYYNKDKFEDKGYQVPETYDELMKLAEKMKKDGETPFLFPDKDPWTLVQCWEDNIDGSARGDRKPVYMDIANGETTFQDDELFAETLQKVVDIHEYGQGDTLALGYDQAISDFATGKACMFMQGIWALPSIKKANPDMNVGMFSFPSNSGDTKVSMGIDVNLAISAKCANAEAAKKFVEFAASIDGATAWDKFRAITIPYLIPVLNMVFVTCVKGGLTTFILYIPEFPSGGFNFENRPKVFRLQKSHYPSAAKSCKQPGREAEDHFGSVQRGGICK